MKRFATAVVAAIGLFSASAYAADLRAPVYKAPPLLSPEPIFNWTGFYAGIDGGYIGGYTHASNVAPAGFLPDVGMQSGLFGIHGGYRWQMPNNFVLGAQVWIPLYVAKQSTILFNNFLNEGEARGGAVFQGQLGYAVGRFMPYLTGGIGFAKIRARETIIGGVTSPWVENTHTVGLLGFGANYAVTQNWTAGLVYNHVFTSNETYNCGPAVCGLVGTFGFKGDIAEAVLEYKF